jgi:hypothetical protein
MLHLNIFDLDMSEYVLLGSTAIGILSGAIGAYLAINYGLKKAKAELPNMLLEAFDILGKETAQNKDLQATFYNIGLLIGNGAKQGIGLSPQGKGQKGLMGLITQFAPMFFKNMTGNSQDAGSTATDSGNQFGLG